MLTFVNCNRDRENAPVKILIVVRTMLLVLYKHMDPWDLKDVGITGKPLLLKDLPKNHNSCQVQNWTQPKSLIHNLLLLMHLDILSMRFTLYQDKMVFRTQSFLGMITNTQKNSRSEILQQSKEKLD